MRHQKPTVLDLFAGVGGFSLGAERAGFHVIGAVENDPEAIEAHARNFPNTRHAQLDLAKEKATRIIEDLGINNIEITGIIGGPPCQGFSAIGKSIATDPRNELFKRFFYYVRELSPEFFIAENVQGILGAKFRPMVENCIKTVRGNYEVLPPLTVSAKDFGAPTTRTRVFIVGFKKRKGRTLPVSLAVPPRNGPLTTVEMALQGLPHGLDNGGIDESGYWKVIHGFPADWFGEKVKGQIPSGVGWKEAILRLRSAMEVSGFTGTNHTKEVLRRFSKTKQGEEEPISRYWRLAKNGLCPTLRAGTGRERGSFQAARPIHPTEDRVITTREAARLQGFPDWFVFSKTKWASFRQIGNSVCPIVAEGLFSLIEPHLT